MVWNYAWLDRVGNFLHAGAAVKAARTFLDGDLAMKDLNSRCVKQAVDKPKAMKRV
jgi:hypothetical protein